MLLSLVYLWNSFLLLDLLPRYFPDHGKWLNVWRHGVKLTQYCFCHLLAVGLERQVSLKPEHLSCKISVHTPRVMWKCTWHITHLSWAVNHIFQNLWLALFPSIESYEPTAGERESIRNLLAGWLPVSPLSSAMAGKILSAAVSPHKQLSTWNKAGGPY